MPDSGKHDDIGIEATGTLQLVLLQEIRRLTVGRVLEQDGEAVGVLLGALEEEDRAVAEAAAWALGHMVRRDQ